jgi:hypothetical protein
MKQSNFLSAPNSAGHRRFEIQFFNLAVLDREGQANLPQNINNVSKSFEELVSSRHAPTTDLAVPIAIGPYRSNILISPQGVSRVQSKNMKTQIHFRVCL